MLTSLIKKKKKILLLQAHKHITRHAMDSLYVKQI